MTSFTAGPDHHRRHSVAHPGRVLLHVGMHRTGTTAFQRYVADWRAELLLEHGILVHRGCFLPSHLEVPALVIRQDLLTPDRWLLDDHGYEMGADAMRQAIRTTVESDAGTVLFSTEGLSYMRTPEEVKRVQELLAPREVTAIVVLRNKVDYLASFRAALQRMGFSVPTQDPDPGTVAYTEPDSWLVDYSALLNVLRDLTGPRRLHVIDYEREVAATGSIIPALAEAIGLQRSALYPGWDRRDNVTPTASATGDGTPSLDSLGDVATVPTLKPG